MGRRIPISKYSLGIIAEMTNNRVITVATLKLGLRSTLFSIFIMFMNCLTKITISIPEKSSVAIALKRVKASKEPVYSKPATINLPPFFDIWN